MVMKMDSAPAFLGKKAPIMKNAKPAATKKAPKAGATLGQEKRKQKLSVTKAKPTMLAKASFK